MSKYYGTRCAGLTLARNFHIKCFIKSRYLRGPRRPLRYDRLKRETVDRRFVVVELIGLLKCRYQTLRLTG